MGIQGAPRVAGRIVIRLGGSSFGMDGTLLDGVSRVREVVPFVRPGSAVCGLANVKGRTVPVCDLAELIGAPRPRIGANSRMVVAKGERGAVAFIVDSVRRPVKALDGTDADLGAALSDAELI